MIERIMEEKTRRGVASTVHIWVSVLLRHRHRFHDRCVLEEIAACSGAGNARNLELEDLYEAQRAAWRDLYGGDAHSSALGYDRLLRISTR